jgi:hypothetical protein
MRLNWLATIAAMALPFVTRKSPTPPDVPYRSSLDTAVRARSREDQSLMGHRFPLM